MALAEERQYTYADIMSWDDGKRYELYDGVPVALASPQYGHQHISMQLGSQINAMLQGTGCEVLSAFDVRPFAKRGEDWQDERTVVTPDLLIVCNSGKIENHSVLGPPDLAIEILSDSTRRNDLVRKFNIYQQAGVPEYWIINPHQQVVSVYRLEDGAYHAAETYAANSLVPLTMTEDASVDLSRVFPKQ